ncbi:UNVERIFIED_CONTAM: hypothetical protein Slati_0125600 [Sesamum latifolium]|uniref:Uncharacterized protein n=1 Tax=Sesamum latifolium TaxID=2727402 RepID=A0AAW2Y9E0_9LAMI
MGGQRRNRFLDLNYLRPWARHVISPEEVDELIQLVQRAEIKAAVFDIAEDKASGPNGFSSGFYKAAWPVICDEITQAVQDFFTSDMRKAYDLHEWDFVLASLRLFGFPNKLLAWIEECISTAYFSVSLNGEMHDFFPWCTGTRLRGFDVPLSVCPCYGSFAAAFITTSGSIRAFLVSLAVAELSKTIETRMRAFLWQGGFGSGMAKDHGAGVRFCAFRINSLETLSIGLELVRPLWFDKTFGIS